MRKDNCTYNITIIFPDFCNRFQIFPTETLEADVDHIYIGKWICKHIDSAYHTIKQEESTDPAENQSNAITLKLYNIFFSIYSDRHDMYVYSGRNDINVNSIKIPTLNIKTHDIAIKCRRIPQQKIMHDFMNTINVTQLQPRRTKEREIGTIIRKVFDWRQLYTLGKKEGRTGKTIKMSLDDAAKEVGISKKSLDDYLLQIRYGKEYGYDFETNKTEKVGNLRKFVKESKYKALISNQTPQNIFEIRRECPDKI